MFADALYKPQKIIFVSSAIVLINPSIYFEFPPTAFSGSMNERIKWKPGH